MMVAATRLPVIAICGTTGVGKSQLAVELALHLSKTAPDRARIINADAMQCYAGMDIITNKMPEAQRHGVEHLLMGFKQPGEQYVVGQWVQDSMKAVSYAHTHEGVHVFIRYPVDRRDPQAEQDTHSRWWYFVLDPTPAISEPTITI